MRKFIAALFIATAALAAIAQEPAEAKQNAQSAKSALLPSSIGLHLGSKHSDPGSTAPGSLGWNNHNVGVYAVWDLHTNSLGTHGIGGGYIHRNSLFKPSVYVAYHYTTPSLTTALGLWSLGGNVGAFLAGYDKAINPGVDHNGPVPAGHEVRIRCMDTTGCVNQLVKPTIVPMLAASVAWQAKPSWPTVRLSYLPRSGSVGSSAKHLSVEYRF